MLSYGRPSVLNIIAANKEGFLCRMHDINNFKHSAFYVSVLIKAADHHRVHSFWYSWNNGYINIFYSVF